MNELAFILILLKEFFGLEIFRNENQLLGLLGDLFPDMDSERYMIRNLVQFGIFENFIQNIDNSPEEKNRVVELSKLELIEERFINSEVAQQYVDILSRVFGFTEGTKSKENQITELLNINKTPYYNYDSLTQEVCLEVQIYLEKANVLLEALNQTETNPHMKWLYINTLLRLGIIKSNLKLDTEAEKLFSKMIQIIEEDSMIQQKLQVQFLKSSTWYRLSEIQKREKNLFTAELSLRKAINCLLSLRNQSNLEFETEETLASYWKLLGDLCIELSKYAEAELYFNKSLNIFFNLKQNLEEDENTLRRLCSTIESKIRLSNVTDNNSDLILFTEELTKMRLKLLHLTGEIKQIVEYVQSLFLFAEAEERLNHIVKSESTYNKIVHTLRNSKDLRLRQLLAKAYLKMGNLQFKLNNLTKARIFYKEAKYRYSNLDLTEETKLNEFSEVLWHLALIETRMDMSESAFSNFKLLSTIFQEVFSKVSDEQKRQIVKKLITLGNVYKNLHEYNRAEKVLDLALIFQKEIIFQVRSEEDMTLLADITFVLSSIQKDSRNFYYALKNATQANSYYQDIYKLFPSKSIKEKQGSVDLLISEIYQLDNKEKESKEYLFKALSLNKELVDFNPIEYILNKDIDKPSDVLEQQVELNLHKTVLSDLRDNILSEDINKERLAQDFELLGILEAELLHQKEAEANFFKSVEIYKDLFSQQNTLERGLDYLDSLDNLSSFYFKNGFWKEALHYEMLALDLFSKLIIKQPELKSKYKGLYLQIACLYQIFEEEVESEQYLKIYEEIS